MLASFSPYISSLHVYVVRGKVTNILAEELGKAHDIWNYKLRGKD